MREPENKNEEPPPSEAQTIVEEYSGKEVRENSWQDLLKKSYSSAKQIAEKTGLKEEEIRAVIKKYPAKINPYYFSLIREKDDPIWKQCIPKIEELEDTVGLEDPLREEGEVPGITHKYPDRVLFIISNQCAMYCRFCTRKRKVGDPNKDIKWSDLHKGIEYIRSHPEVRDVVLSGGDPLLIETKRLEKIIKLVRAIPHVEIIRIGTRVPCVLPQRIDQELCDMLKKYHPIYINTHFNHPSEITPESKKACEMLADAGIPLGNQTVLLKGVNDNAEVLKELFKKLLTIRVKPYYIYQADMVKGTDHFRTKVEDGINLIGQVIGHTSGLCVPHFVVDGAGGKTPLLPHYLQYIDDEIVILKNYQGKKYIYKQPQQE
ncbi:MAG: KamA family radical SAM protein [Candidatus Nanoarchaeia archaeon]